MNSSILNYSYVLVFKQPLATIPSLDINLRASAFDNAFTVTCTETQDRIVLVAQNRFQSIEIDKVRIVLTSESIKSLKRMIEEVGKAFPALLSKENFSQYGLNCEIEFSNLAEYGPKWIWDSIIRNSTVAKHGSFCNRMDLALGINEEEVYNITLEVRNSNNSAVYTIVNHHHINPPTKPFDGDEIVTEVENSVSSFIKDYFNVLTNQ